MTEQNPPVCQCNGASVSTMQGWGLRIRRADENTNMSITTKINSHLQTSFRLDKHHLGLQAHAIPALGITIHCNIGLRPAFIRGITGINSLYAQDSRISILSHSLNSV